MQIQWCPSLKFASILIHRSVAVLRSSSFNSDAALDCIIRTRVDRRCASVADVGHVRNTGTHPKNGPISSSTIALVSQLYSRRSRVRIAIDCITSAIIELSCIIDRCSPVVQMISVMILSAAFKFNRRSAADRI
jgi:hypothetical protein